MRVVFDTDIGTDIDDAIALAYLLQHPDCELAGITTVTGQPMRRAAIASAIVKAAGLEVPIHIGAPMPLTGHCRQPVADQADALGDWAHETAFPELSAVEWMRQTIRRYPGEVTLLATGPLTNVGLLAALDPEATGMLRSLVIMGGRFGPVPPPRGDVEWNMRCDAVAAERTVTTPGCPLRAVGLDVTTRVTMPAEAVRKRFAAPVLEPVRDFAEIWFRRTDEVVFHDPLAAACVFDPSLCTWEAGTVEVELQSTRLAGHTTFTPAPDGAHRIARTVDAGRFLDHYFEIVRG